MMELLKKKKKAKKIFWLFNTNTTQNKIHANSYEEEEIFLQLNRLENTC